MKWDAYIVNRSDTFDTKQTSTCGTTIALLHQSPQNLTYGQSVNSNTDCVDL